MVFGTQVRLMFTYEQLIEEQLSRWMQPEGIGTTSHYETLGQVPNAFPNVLPGTDNKLLALNPQHKGTKP